MMQEQTIGFFIAAAAAPALGIVGVLFARKALTARRTGVAITATRAEHRRADGPLLYWLTLSLQGINALACVVLGIASLGLALFLLVSPIHQTICSRSRPASEMAALAVAAESYKQDYGQYPSGNNRAVQQALTGENSLHKAYVELNKSQLSSDGQIVDPWGTPYQFRAGEYFYIRCAGPNRKFEAPGTPGSDDISNDQP